MRGRALIKTRQGWVGSTASTSRVKTAHREFLRSRWTRRWGAVQAHGEFARVTGTGSRRDQPGVATPVPPTRLAGRGVPWCPTGMRARVSLLTPQPPFATNLPRGPDNGSPDLGHRIRLGDDPGHRRSPLTVNLAARRREGEDSDSQDLFFLLRFPASVSGRPSDNTLSRSHWGGE